jgi:multicomponent Na+:H+ antiporter subunit E
MITVANVITLTPGTMTLESKGSPATLYVNVLQLHDPNAVRRDVADIERRAVKAFGSRKSREQLLSQTKEQT